MLQRLYNLSDDQTEFQIRDRASFQRFLGLHVEDGSPDSKTIWSFKERVKEIELTDALFARFDGALSAQGLSAKGGQIVDAVIVEVPRQRNTPEENALIKEGKVPASWVEQPAKLAQKKDGCVPCRRRLNA
jgi:transposase, IS5 family